ncbi:AraC family transcriptional regulator [Pseudomonas fontis]|uniref:AraC family transcriptional regulator n=1 Tax=Pseudomonas fontis TaxID=2942633 RepID=A0ABT5NXX7_9PSED|nr:AraC family transcriptional regulator [Pseudomonas fontis]MDD0972526.1 AraC family transcriptional regulator [Pseudomonas fontis]MDD0993050.1 AraC family transcriptional regulator [Pseudomonas fontis]
MTYLTRASALHRFDEFAISQNLNPSALLREAGLPADVLEQPDNLIAYERFSLLVELSAQASNNPTFGLQFGLFQGVGIFGSLFYLARNAGSVGEALLDLSRYFHVHNNFAEVVLHRMEEHALLCYSSRTETLSGNRQVSELVVGVGHQLMRTLLGSRWQPTTVLFQHAPLASPSVYRRLLGVAPRFNSAYDAWMFDEKLLATPLSAADKALHKLMQQHLDSMSAMGQEELPGYVQRLLRSLLPSGRVTVDYIADFMKTSPRSLQRRLAEEGTSFQKLLDETRQSMTLRYLKESDMNLIQLTEILGYSDQSAFSRAFQRWFGSSPREWMKQHNLRPQGRIQRR